ncbi:MAG: hypothetical protein JWO17_3148, partial [Actinomycetia bacterium]|nr:hypothetical protein [Actinomycetes bacterium]
MTDEQDHPELQEPEAEPVNLIGTVAIVGFPNVG